jgi:hypothetical protein
MPGFSAEWNVLAVVVIGWWLILAGVAGWVWVGTRKGK